MVAPSCQTRSLAFWHQATGGHMSKERQRLADGLLRAAETRQQCAVTHSRAMRAALERRRASRQVTSPVRGLYVRPAYWSSLDPAQKALHVIRGIAALRPKTVFSHTSAALVHGLPVSWHELGSIHVMRSPTSHRKGTGLFVCHSSKSFEAVSVRGVRVTPLVRTAIDCMRARSCSMRLTERSPDHAASKGRGAPRRLPTHGPRAAASPGRGRPSSRAASPCQSFRHA